MLVSFTYLLDNNNNNNHNGITALSLLYPPLPSFSILYNDANKLVLNFSTCAGSYICILLHFKSQN